MKLFYHKGYKTSPTNPNNINTISEFGKGCDVVSKPDVAIYLLQKRINNASDVSEKSR